ncbi:MAG: hypothetical protein A3G52_00410 [Candidatus Taylorbacteria bacterium RIFCSPLOWO2_12_FULL_43_20]|uniref:Mur ligase central domain-containing protein n=1 Tax=Candidatus Taylorbacteria bacterium RIFCSPLOWO2_12_FULL_43_20 TaxID=1802332 RepID=A0A1G2P1K2_9BACT|nr:MAG: hypothetical protein A2825_01820 [Candidatus Taylorbacteria bacterium RIFCSPHIGHO2_01_FULL_43_120]OHA28943.1 MAG: hypothetical protein A3E92_04730 [Candidatus Taylorbacteria bacterium RIFCSPHIGHO2_12_FULL_42_34]OHA31831.1 MAG: hypothetical protein A3B09_03595 [Candidatus Taylorbacteria bacterium RIFCSPLOWO2_01_FULL_43_83]OHA37756.1 MAG: hypothetical protein A3H58_01220 [Candidatus Taylorbacteria bacterium RIFCSPLOWO2_02_FULL_43_22b]OHA42200.1 MAG: hypothetical protein A3G52_00410 [Candi
MKNILKETIINILTFEAKLAIKKYKPKIIGITGSVGKTSAKDAVYQVLARQYFVRKSAKSFNSEIGVPLTVLGLPNGWNNPFVWLGNIVRGAALVLLPMDYPTWLILEIGADRPNDIKNITRWIKPDIAIITRFGDLPVHIEFFNSKKQLIEEKSYLVWALKKEGVLIVNNDDPDARKLGSEFNGKLTVGIENQSDITASHAMMSYRKDDKGEECPVGLNFKANFLGNSIPVSLTGVLGAQHIYPALFGIATGISSGLSVLSVCDSFSKFTAAPGRMRLVPGIRNSIIIDDSYNSSPVALEEALKTLRDISVKKRKIAVFGDMMELGAYSKEAHVNAGKMTSAICHTLITVGLRARDIASGALSGGMSEKNILQFDNVMQAAKYMDGIIGEGDIVLVKGSQTARLEKIVEEIMAFPRDKEKILVRQDAAWKKR